MNAGVGAPGTGDGDLLTQQQGQRPLQGLLDTAAVGLYLPAVVGCAVVAEFDEVTQGELRVDS